MALRQIDPSREEKDELLARFGIIADNKKAVRDQEQRVLYEETIRDLISDTALAIQQVIEPGREQALALTHLEEALMWTGKAIFK